MEKSKANDNVSVTNIMPFRNGQKINKNNEISFEKGAKNSPNFASLLLSAAHCFVSLKHEMAK